MARASIVHFTITTTVRLATLTTVTRRLRKSGPRTLGIGPQRHCCSLRGILLPKRKKQKRTTPPPPLQLPSTGSTLLRLLPIGTPPSGEPDFGAQSVDSSTLVGTDVLESLEWPSCDVVGGGITAQLIYASRLVNKVHLPSPRDGCADAQPLLGPSKPKKTLSAHGKRLPSTLAPSPKAAYRVSETTECCAISTHTSRNCQIRSRIRRVRRQQSRGRRCELRYRHGATLYELAVGLAAPLTWTPGESQGGTCRAQRRSSDDVISPTSPLASNHHIRWGRPSQLTGTVPLPPFSTLWRSLATLCLSAQITGHRPAALRHSQSARRPGHSCMNTAPPSLESRRDMPCSLPRPRLQTASPTQGTPLTSSGLTMSATARRAGWALTVRLAHDFFVRDILQVHLIVHVRRPRQRLSNMPPKIGQSSASRTTTCYSYDGGGLRLSSSSGAPSQSSPSPPSASRTASAPSVCCVSDEEPENWCCSGLGNTGVLYEKLGLDAPLRMDVGVRVTLMRNLLTGRRMEVDAAVAAQVLHILSDEMITFLKEHSRTISPVETQPADTHVLSSTKQSGFLVPKPDIPLSPPALSKDDYDNAKFWSLEDWNGFQVEEKRFGKEPPRLDFLTDEEGDVVSPARKKEFYEWFSVLAASLFRAREDPKTWKKKTKFASDNPSINVNAGSVKRKREEDFIKLEPLQKKSKKVKRPESETVISLDSEGEDSGKSSGSALVRSESVAPVNGDKIIDKRPKHHDRPVAPPSVLGNSTSTAASPPAAPPALPSGGRLSPQPLDVDVNAGAKMPEAVSNMDQGAIASAVPSPNVHESESELNALTKEIPASLTVASKVPLRKRRGRRPNPLSRMVIPHPDKELLAPVSTDPPAAPGSALPPSSIMSAPKKGGKLMQPSNANTPRNLFAIDYLKDHPITSAEFKIVWASLDKDMLKNYEDLSREKKKTSTK
ncbi:hypothetical protein HYPSUDRAFT_206534 [Hypholoma sublateritium FD-334 SS-4]|uniref:Uncharacterized protein n=1 Tax=Hypholoma sublateritium (strain FD-334 SS-4) TaxID=945553 RepID=A0A0D2P9N7_HYPSF|nr:hypothetical protein HYPSUDRAFT_206534 [Hypholoma sublateritium FD-334 SS-4]